MLVQRDDPGRDALILAGPALSGTKHLDDERSAGSMPRATLRSMDPAAWLSTAS